MTTLDTVADQLIEKHGIQYKAIIQSVVDDLKKPMQQEIEKNRALLLGRVACYIVSSKTSNVLARVHGLLHAIPGLARINGFYSMRESARICGVTPEWMRKARNAWCNEMGLPQPSEGVKSDEAREKYRLNSLNNHWRNQKISIDDIV